ncbi:MAG: hypothetical protein K0S54_3495 [Alphaproteobacteria bacterium]|jgi:hypothetical protein|nr:hypothetical protein [Alphaproteobacteria bacterium]
MSRTIPYFAGAAALMLAAGSAQAQSNSGRLLDSLVRGMQICSEINDSASRLGCYDEVNRTATGRAPASAPSPRPAPGYVPSPSAVGPGPAVGPGTPPYAAPSYDADRAFDPNAQRSATVPPEMLAEIVNERRTGPGPIPRGNPPLVTLGPPALNYNEGNYRWLIMASVTNNTSRTLDASITCALSNNDRRVTDLNWFPSGVRPGETVTVEMLGPSTQAYANAVLCRVNSPI